MTTPRLAASTPLLCTALLLGLVACKQSPPPTSADNQPTTAAGPESASAADAVNPLTSPREAVVASMRKFMDARSYHASMQFSGGPRGPMTNELDFVAPDRFRMEMAGMGTQYVIGDTMYMSMQGRSMQVPMPKGTTTQWRDPGNFREAEAALTVDALGSETIGGVDTRKYLVHHTTPKPADITLWIGADDLPVQMQVGSQVNGQPMTTTVRYSRINDPAISIEPPK